MNDEVKLILTKLKIVSEEKENGAYICDKEHSKLLLLYIEQLENNRDKAIEEIDNLLVYDDFSDTTKGFGNIPEQLKFYLSDYDNLEEFRKNILKGGSDE